VTELIYRHQIRPVIQSGATIMDRLFGPPPDRRAAEAVAIDNGIASQARPGERNSFSATLVTQLVTQALVINSSVTIEMHSDEADQWSG
jgi:hypothetical protein